MWIAGQDEIAELPVEVFTFFATVPRPKNLNDVASFQPRGPLLARRAGRKTGSL